MPQTKRDCLKLGIASLEQLDGIAVPPGRIRCKVHVALRTGDTGEQYNRIRRFDVLGIDAPTADAFAPADSAAVPAREYDPDADGDASFDPAKLEGEAKGGAA